MATEKKAKKAAPKKAPAKSEALVAWERRCELCEKIKSGKVTAKEQAEIKLISSQRGDCEPGNKPA
tara:strand:+ start:16772 stop:16969 length:198 start_codon:yes stop_codon:yes gene_type:complete